MATRITGSSGMDIEKLVTDLMKPRKAQLEKLQQKQTKVEWKKTDMQTLYTALSDFRNTAADYKRSALLAPKKTTSTDETKVTAAANADAVPGVHTIETSVLATGLNMFSSSTVTATGKTKDTLETQFDIKSDFILAVNGKAIQVKKDWSLNDVAAAINFVSLDNSGVQTVRSNYDTALDKFFMTTATTGAYDSQGGARLDFSGSDALGISFVKDMLKMEVGGLATANSFTANRASIAPVTVNGSTDKSSLNTQFGSTTLPTTIKFTINNSTAITVDKTKPMSQLMTDIMAANSDITASYDSSVDRVFLSSKTNTPLTFNTAAVPPLTDDEYASGLSFLANQLKIDVPNVKASNSSLTDPGTNTLAAQFVTSSAIFSLKVNGSTSISIDTGTDTMATMVAKINAATHSPAGNIVASFDANSKQLRFVAKDGSAVNFTGSDAAGLNFLTDQLKVLSTTKTDVPITRTSSGTIAASAADLATQFGMGSDNFNLRINGIDLTVNPTAQSLNDLMTAITSSSAGVTASYDSTNNRVTLTRSDGSNSPIDFAGSSGAAMQFLTNDLKLIYTSPSSYAVRGKDAELKFDGAATTSHTNDYKKDNVTYTLKATNVGTPATVTVAADIDLAIANMKKFVEAYNNVLNKFNTEVKEKRYKLPGDKYTYFEPLTDEQKTAMKDSDISKWEEKAKSGLLFSDPLLSGVISSLRADATDPIKRYPTAAIDTTGQNDGMSTKLLFNEPLYKSLGGSPPIMSPIASGTDVSSRFQYTGRGTFEKAIYNIDSSGKASVTFTLKTSTWDGSASPSGTPVYPPAVGDTITLKSDDASAVYNSVGVAYKPQPLTAKLVTKADGTTDPVNYSGTYTWSYPTPANGENYGTKGILTAESIGISTSDGSGYLQYKDGGKLYIDETKLRAALTADADILKKIMGTDSTTSDRDGIAVRLYDSATTKMKEMAREGGIAGAVVSNSNLDKIILDYGTQIYDLKDRMSTEENRYYKRFAAMEKAINQLNSQSSWLSQQTAK